MKSEKLRKGIVHCTDTELNWNPEGSIEKNLAAATTLFPQEVLKAVEPYIKRGIVSVRIINGKYVPVLHFRNDVGDYTSKDAIDFVNALQQLNINDVQSKGVHLEWGPGHTISTEAAIAGSYLNKQNDIRTLQDEPAYFLAVEPSLKDPDLAGDICTTVHPIFQKYLNALSGGQQIPFTVILPELDETVLNGCPELKLASVRAIAPTPGEIGRLIDVTSPRLIQGGSTSIVFGKVRAEVPELLNSRAEDVAALDANGFKHLSIATNQLFGLQTGDLSAYAPNLSNTLALLRPYDAKYMASGAVHDPTNPMTEIYQRISGLEP